MINIAYYTKLKKRLDLLDGEIYGVEWNQTTDTYTRLADAKNLTAGADFDDTAGWAMKRCNLADDGTVNAFYGEAGYAEDGSNGQVMVRIPKFYYRAEINDVEDKIYRWYISAEPLSGFSIHPAFVRNGIEKDYVYIGAYEATLYDDSAIDYVGDGVTYDYANDMLASVAGLQPLSGNTDHFDIVEARQLAQNRGAGWNLQDFFTVSAVQLLYLVEYADFNTQSAISESITNLDSGTGNHAQNTGHTSTLGNDTGEVVISTLENGATGATETYAMSYRGIENLYGNIWNFVDGVNINDNVPYVADNNFASDVFSGEYESLGVILSSTNGYASDIAYNNNYNFGFLPVEVSGSSSTELADYYHQSSGQMVALLGGSWTDGSRAGGFRWYLDSSSTGSARAIGARLAFI